MRSGEVSAMRGCDLDTAGAVWTYTPSTHKTEHHGVERPIYLGPKAQDVLRPFLKTDLGAYLFDPRKAVEDHRAERRKHRRTPMSPSQAKRRRTRSATATRPSRTAGPSRGLAPAPIGSPTSGTRPCARTR
jgi:integrase